MKKINKIAEIYNNKELKIMAIEQQEKWLRAKIVMQFICLREKKVILNKKLQIKWE